MRLGFHFQFEFLEVVVPNVAHIEEMGSRWPWAEKSSIFHAPRLGMLSGRPAVERFAIEQ